MLLSKMTFTGVDPATGERPMVYASLDSDLRLLALGAGRLDDVLAFLGGQHYAAAAICAPRRPNQGVMGRPQVRNSLVPAPKPGRWMDFRLAEYLLRQRNLKIPKTPALEDECPRWIQQGFELYRQLEQLGYQDISNVNTSTDQIPPLLNLEVYPHACYSVLLGQVPLPKATLEGRIQRQLVLYAQEVKVPDPMLFFEEVTRFRLMRGILPTDNLYTPSELDALIAAFTAWMAVKHPGQVTLIGDAGEGQIVLPVTELKTHYQGADSL